LINVAELARNPELRQSLGLERMGAAGVLLPLISKRLNTLVLATKADAPGSIAIFDSSITPEQMIQMAAGLGVTVAAEPELYQEFEVWKGNAFGLTALALAGVEKNTTVVAQAPVSADGPTATGLLRQALDSSLDQEGSFAAQPEIDLAVNGLSAGLMLVLSQDCDLPSKMLTGDWSGCVGSALSVVAVREGTLTLRTLLVFETEAQAMAALEAMPREGIGASRQEGRLLHLQTVGDTDRTLAVLTSQILQ
jgi:hypothetical protein